MSLPGRYSYLVISLFLLVSSIFIYPHAGQPSYTHDLERVSASEVPPEADVLQYADLSANAKTAIRDARRDDGIRYGEGNEPPEFFYSDYAKVNRGVYYIQQNGTYYRLTTFAGGSSFPANLLFKWSLALLGLGIGLLGYVSRQGNPRLSVGTDVFGVLVSLGVLSLLVETPVPSVDRVFLLLVTLSGALCAFVLFGAIARRSVAVRAVALLFVLLVSAGASSLLSGISGLPVPAVDLIGFVVISLGAAGVGIGRAGRIGYRRIRSRERSGA